MSIVYLGNYGGGGNDDRSTRKDDERKFPAVPEGDYDSEQKRRH
jgi:hypothetical protein